MDPISPVSLVGLVASLGQGVYTVSTKLYTFIENAKVVDHTMKSLRIEVESLKSALDGIKTAMDEILKVGIDLSSPTTRAAWQALDNGLKDCEITVNALEDLLEKISPETNTPKTLKKVLKQIRLDMGTNGISAVKSRIRTHTSSLQISLQVLVLLQGYRSTSRLNDIERKIDSVVKLLNDFHTPAHDVIAERLPAGFENLELTAHTTQLQQAARNVLVEASTARSERSIAEDTSGYNPSLHGIPVDDARRRLIDDWNSKTMVGDENDNQIGLQFESSIDGSASTVVESHPELDELDENIDRRIHKILHAARLDPADASFDANVALRSFLETYFDEADGFLRLGLTPKLERTVRYLRSKGAETDRPWEDGWTASQFVSDFGNEPLVKLLVEDQGLVGDIKLLKDQIQALEGNITKIYSEETQCRRAWEASLQQPKRFSIKGNKERNAKEKELEREVHRLKREGESSMRELEMTKTKLHNLKPGYEPLEKPINSPIPMTDLIRNPLKRPIPLKSILKKPIGDIAVQEQTRKDEQPASWLWPPISSFLGG